MNRIPDLRQSGEIAARMLHRSLMHLRASTGMRRHRSSRRRRHRRPLPRHVAAADHLHDGGPALDLVGDRHDLAAKAIERVGDHAKNIAEHVIFIAHGADVRHASPEEIERAFRRGSRPWRFDPGWSKTSRRSRSWCRSPAATAATTCAAPIRSARAGGDPPGAARPGDPRLDAAGSPGSRNCCARLRGDERTRRLPIIMLTARSAESDRVAGLDAGADDYVVKPFSPRELVVAGAGTVRRRAPQHSGEALSYGPLTIDPARHEVAVDGRPGQDGMAEFKLLKYLVGHPSGSSRAPAARQRVG